MVLSHEESFVLQSPVSGRHTVKASILVNNKDGLEQAEVGIYGDAFESLVSFSGEIVTPSGGRNVVVFLRCLPCSSEPMYAVMVKVSPRLRMLAMI